MISTTGQRPRKRPRLLVQDSQVVDTSVTEPESPEKRRVTRWQKAQKLVKKTTSLVQRPQLTNFSRNMLFKHR